jgi:threonine dehydratase
MADRESMAEEVLAKTGGTLVHPYNDVDVRASH